MIKIFLITASSNTHPGKLIYADNEDEARVAMHDPIYLDETSSECKQVAVEIINSYSCSSRVKLDAIMIQYNDKTYHLKKNEAQDV